MTFRKLDENGMVYYDSVSPRYDEMIRNAVEFENKYGNARIDQIRTHKSELITSYNQRQKAQGKEVLFVNKVSITKRYGVRLYSIHGLVSQMTIPAAAQLIEFVNRYR